MNGFVAAALGLAGVGLGFFTPDISQKIALHKCKKSDKELAEDKRYTSILLKLIFCILNASVWALAGIYMENLFAAILLSILFSAAVMITVLDLHIRIIPNELVLVMLAVGIAFQAVQFGFKALAFAALTMLIIMIVFTLLAGITGFGMVGAGDVKLAGAMGLALGYPNIFTALIVMAAALLIYSLGGLLLKKLTLRSTFPLAPFLMSGMVIALLCIIFVPGLLYEINLLA